MEKEWITPKNSISKVPDKSGPTKGFSDLKPEDLPSRNGEYEYHMGENLKVLRTSKGLTLAEVGQNFEMSAAMYHKYETGIIEKPSIHVALKFAEYYGVSLDTLVREKLVLTVATDVKRY